jgi:predicted metal-dependent phosphoesterase TrpH
LEFIEGIKIHCFGKEIKVKEFIPKVDKIFNLLANFELPIDEIIEYLEEAQKEKNRLDKEIEKNKKLNNEMIERYNLAKDYFERYLADWPLKDTINKLQQKKEKKGLNNAAAAAAAE